MLNSTGKRETTLQREHDDPDITLGVHCTPNGNMKNQVKQMHSDARDWADKLAVGQQDRASACVALTTTTWKN